MEKSSGNSNIDLYKLLNVDKNCSKDEIVY